MQQTENQSNNKNMFGGRVYIRITDDDYFRILHVVLFTSGHPYGPIRAHVGPYGPVWTRISFDIAFIWIWCGVYIAFIWF